MKTFVLVLSLELVAGCGAENRYADTLASRSELIQAIIDQVGANSKKIDASLQI